jgi:hypothetical protein
MHGTPLPHVEPATDGASWGRLEWPSATACRPRCRIGGEWLTKVDVGWPSEQPDPGDRLKAGFSAARTRAAGKFGIGRYPYRLPSQWVDYDRAPRGAMTGMSKWAA